MNTNNMMKLIGSMALALSALGSAQAFVTTNVSTAAELVGAINAINVQSDAYKSTIILAPGAYDVSSYHMQGIDDNLQPIANTFAHIAVRRVMIKGMTDDPRDTVIYGNASGDRVVYGYNTTLSNLTISNGYAKAGGGLIANGGGALAQNSTYSNVVFTCNRAGDQGGGAYNGYFYDCKFIGNQSANQGGGCAGNKGATYFSGFMYRCEVRGNYSGYNGGGTFGNYGEDCQIVGNTVKWHGGGDCEGELRRCVISDNASESNASDGGGCYGSVLYDCDVLRNVVSRRGGGICLGKAYDSRINYNLVTNATGAVYGGGVDRTEVVGCEIAGNAITGGTGKETRQGGGTFGANCTGCVIKNNFVFSGIGGGVNGGTLNGCVISNNIAWSDAPGQSPQPSIRQISGCVENCDIYESVLDIECAMNNCRIMNYTNANVLAKGDNAFTNGYFHGLSYLSVYHLCATNCLFSGIRLRDTAPLLNYGNSNKDGALVNCTVADCVINAVMMNLPNTCKFDVINCVFSGNVSTKGDCSDLMYGADAKTLRLDHCLCGNTLPSVDLVYEPVNVIENESARFCRRSNPG